MATTDAQKRATQRYREKRGGVKDIQKTIGATLNPLDAEKIKTALKSVNLSNADALKRVAARIEQGDDLRRDYDKATNTLVAADNEN